MVEAAGVEAPSRRNTRSTQPLPPAVVPKFRPRRPAESVACNVAFRGRSSSPPTQTSPVSSNPGQRFRALSAVPSRIWLKRVGRNHSRARMMRRSLQVAAPCLHPATRRIAMPQGVHAPWARTPSARAASEKWALTHAPTQLNRAAGRPLVGHLCVAAELRVDLRVDLLQDIAVDDAPVEHAL